MRLKSDDYVTLTGDATPESIVINVQAEDDPETSFSWELSVECAYELIESLMVMVMGYELFDRLPDAEPELDAVMLPINVVRIPIAKLYVEWLEHDRAFGD